MKNISSRLTPACLAMFFALTLNAQTGGTNLPANDPPPPPPTPTGIPIDGGLSILLAAGVGFGAKKLHDNRKKATDK